MPLAHPRMPEEPFFFEDFSAQDPVADVRMDARAADAGGAGHEDADIVEQGRLFDKRQVERR